MQLNDPTPFRLARLCLLNLFILCARVSLWGAWAGVALIGLKSLDRYFVTDLERWLVWGLLALAFAIGRIPYATDPRPAEQPATPTAAPVDL